MAGAFAKLFEIYRCGFRDSRLFRKPLLLVGIKLFIMFAILRIFFFPNLLGGKSPEEKADAVIEHLIGTGLPSERQ